MQEKLGVKLPPASGGIVILRSSQLKTAQNIVKAIKGLAIVLPLIALLLFVLAVWLADGWRRVALRTTGWCLVGIGLIAVLARRLLSNVVVNSLVKVPANKPAVHQVFAIGTSLLYDIAIAMITYGLVIVVAAWIAGHTRPAHALRRALAPSLREHVPYVYATAGWPCCSSSSGDRSPRRVSRCRSSASRSCSCSASEALREDDRAGIPRRAGRRYRARDPCVVCRRRHSTVSALSGDALERCRPAPGQKHADRRPRASWPACTTAACSPTRSSARRRRCCLHGA